MWSSLLVLLELTSARTNYTVTSPSLSLQCLYTCVLNYRLVLPIFLNGGKDVFTFKVYKKKMLFLEKDKWLS